MKKIMIKKEIANFLDTLLESIFLLAIIGIYAYLYQKGIFQNYIGKASQPFSIIGIIILVIIEIPKIIELVKRFNEINKKNKTNKTTKFEEKNKLNQDKEKTELKQEKTKEEENKKVEKVAITTLNYGKLIYLVAIIFVVIAGDGKLSEVALNNKRNLRGSNLNIVSESKEEKYYETDGIYGKLRENVNEEDKTEDFKSKVKKSNIAYDYKSNTWYIDNRMMVVFEDIKTYNEAKEFAEKNNMKLIGQIISINQFTFELPNIMSYENLIKQKEILAENKETKIVDLEYPPIEAVEDLKKEGFDKLTDEEQALIYKKYQNSDGIIEADNSNYVRLLEEIYSNPKIFKDKKIKVIGRTFKDQIMQDGYMGIGMWQMYCCALDMNLIGYLTKFEEKNKLEENKWYQIEGVIIEEEITSQYTNKKSKEPIILIEKVLEIQEPKDSIVY